MWMVRKVSPSPGQEILTQLRPSGTWYYVAVIGLNIGELVVV